MGKSKHPRVLGNEEAKAVNTIIRSSPRKLNLVAEMIRGKSVEKAKAELSFSQKRVAADVLKTLASAISNAENNHGLELDDLIVAEAFVGKRMVMKRFHPRARGRAGGIQKFFSRLTIIVREAPSEDASAKGKKRSAPVAKPKVAKSETPKAEAAHAGAGE
jgi:large subunit ribosomal protein L22